MLSFGPGKPVFPGDFKRKRFQYQAPSIDTGSGCAQSGSGPSRSCWSRKSLDPAMDPPPDKKRKTDTGEYPSQRGTTEEEEDWGDDMDFSQAVLEDLDKAVEGSQAGSSRADHRPPVVTTTVRSAGVGYTVVGPYSATREETSRPGTRVAAVSAPFSSSSKGKLSLARPGQSFKGTRPTRPYPTCSGDPGHLMTAPNVLLESSKEKPDQDEKELEHLKKELQNLKQELEGRITMQRDSLAKKEAEISKLKHEKMRQVEFEQKQRTEKQKKLEADIQRLEYQKQFKDQEITELQDRCRTYEQKVKRLESSAGTSSSSTLTVASNSPRVKVVPDRSPKKSPPSTGFPTQQSFMALESGETPQRRLKMGLTKEKATSTDAMPSASQGTVKCKKAKLQLDCENSMGVLHGAQVWEELLDEQTEASDEFSVTGIIRLLQPLTAAPINFDDVQLEREAGSLLFSPKTSKRNSSLQRTISSSLSFGSQENPPTPAVISAESMSLAVRSVSELLSCTECTDPFNLLTQTGSVSDEELNDFLSRDPAILLLPLINDYLTHYIDMMTTSLDSGLASPSSSLSSSRTGNASSSDGSSFDSLTSSLNILLKNSAAYANNLEKLTLLALQLLYKLVCHCSGVSKFLMQSVFESASPHSQKVSSKSDDEPIVIDQSRKDEPQPGTSKEKERIELSPPSSGSSSIASLCSSLRSNLHILQKLFRLADPGNRDSQLHNQSIVGVSLDILSLLARDSTPDQIDSLSPLVTLGVIRNCFGLESTHSTLIRGLRLLTCLLPSSKISSSLCFTSDGCVLKCIYGLCSNRSFTSSVNRTEIFSEIVDCLSNIASMPGGSTLLLDTRCQCNSEVVKSLTLLLYRLVEDYRRMESERGLSVIRKGVSLLHFLYPHEAQFTDHHYVSLMYSLYCLYKQLPQITEHERSALNELWDFDHDDSDLSQDDDGEEGQMEEG